MTPSREDLRRRLRALAVQDLPLDELWQRSDALLRRAVGWDVAAWGTVDPATLLSTSCLVVGLEHDVERELAVFAFEHDEREPNRLLDLVKRNPPAGGLHDTTAGQPERAPRYDVLLRPLGIVDDLRVALVQGGTCWASLYAYRRERCFTAEEVALLGGLSADLADAVRLCLLRGAAREDQPGGEETPGLLLVGPRGSVTAATEAGRRWLHLLGGSDGVPPVLTALAASLRSADGPASARVQTRDGRWAVVHASTVTGAEAALIVEPARPVVVAEVLAAAYGFTARERDVVGLLLRGESNRLVARELGISEHTVKEHVKAVFAKVGVASRGELAARLLRDQYLPRRGRQAPGPQGWFRESA